MQTPQRLLHDLVKLELNLTRLKLRWESNPGLIDFYSESA